MKSARCNKLELTWAEDVDSTALQAAAIQAQVPVTIWDRGKKWVIHHAEQ